MNYLQPIFGVMLYGLIAIDYTIFTGCSSSINVKSWFCIRTIYNPRSHSFLEKVVTELDVIMIVN